MPLQKNMSGLFTSRGSPAWAGMATAVYIRVLKKDFPCHHNHNLKTVVLTAAGKATMCPTLIYVMKMLGAGEYLFAWWSSLKASLTAIE